MPKVSIVIPVWNQYSFTVGCLESIARCTKDVDYEVIIVDNGSDDGTKIALPELVKLNPRYKIIQNERNLGFPIAVNMGMEFSAGEFICILNNDVIVSDGWLSGLLDVFDKRPNVGIVGPRTNNISGPQVFTEGKYSTIEEFDEFCKTFRKAFRGSITPLWRIVGFCAVFKRALIDKIGNLDERFSPGNFEDDDICLRAIIGGYTNYMVGDVFVHHHGSVSHKAAGENFQNDLVRVNAEKFEAKWTEYSDKQKVTCSMIVKNEEKFIYECLLNAEDKFDEIVIVDTGSTDRTLEIIKQFPKVKLYHFNWCDDFAKARNFADQKATGDWIFSLDADESIPSIKNLTLVPNRAYGFTTRNYTRSAHWKGWVANKGESAFEQGIGWFPSFKVRLYPRDPRIYWQYPVHEVVDPCCHDLGLVRIDSGIPVHHYGKVDEVVDIEKGKNYIGYLQRAIEATPDDRRTLDELATQWQNIGEYEKAIKVWDTYLSISNLETEDEYNGWLNHGHCYASLGDNKQGLESTRKAWKLKPDSREAATNASVILLRMGHPELSIKICLALMNEFPDYPLPYGIYKDSMMLIGLRDMIGGV